MDANIVVTQFTYSALVVWGMQMLKGASWFPLLQNGRARISRAFSVLMALFGHAGISYVWDPTVDSGGYRHLTLAIPTLAAAAVYAWHWLGQFAMQEVMYQGTANKTNTPAVDPASAKV